MLSLVSYGPSYVSPSTTVGQDEAKKFFPVTYKTAEQEREEQAKLNADNPNKKMATEQVKSESLPQPPEEVIEDEVAAEADTAPGA